ncbi:hypothetical protein FOXYS1_7732, partial [Fusarium oxysporum]
MDLPSSHSWSQPSPLSHRPSPPQNPCCTYSYGRNSLPESYSAYFHDATTHSTADNANIYSQPQSNNECHFSNSLHAPRPLPLPASHFIEEWEASQHGSSILDFLHNSENMQRASSLYSYKMGDDQQLPVRQENLDENSLRLNGNLKRSSSRRSMRASIVKSLSPQSTSGPDETHSAFHCPVPTSGNPTDALSNRLQNWRKMLKGLILYFSEIQLHYEHRSNSLLKLANISNNISLPPGFLQSAGIDDALKFLRAYNKNAILDAKSAQEIEENMILTLTGLRNDLLQKIKEIKNLSGDFKTSIEKEMDYTRKAVKALGDVLNQKGLGESFTTSKQDPYLLRLAVDRQIER